MSTHIAYDDVTAGLIPSTAQFVFYYTDGRYANLTAVKARCPSATFIGIAVTASDNAQVLDIENGDATNAQAPAWVKRQLAAGTKRPVLYTSAGNAQALINECAANGVARSSYALWTAHYNQVSHVCGPFERYPQADGTQWTSTSGGKSLDQSLLNDSFFAGGTVNVTPVKPPVANQPTPPTPPAGKARVPDCRGMSPSSARTQLANYGFKATGPAAVANSVCWETNPAHWSMEAPGSSVAFTAAAPPAISQGSTQTPWNEALQTALTRAGISIVIDGSFGPTTDQAVRYFQYEHKLSVDGVAGTNTWNALTSAGSIKPVTPPAPAPAAYTQPGNLRQTGWYGVGLAWTAATLSGKAATSYTVQVLDSTGKQFSQQTVTGTSATVQVAKGKYEIRVWANGGPAAPPHATYELTV